MWGGNYTNNEWKTQVDLPTAAAIVAVTQAAKPAFVTGGRFIEALLGKSFEVAGNMLADQLYSWQLANRVRIANKAKQIIDNDSIPERVIPPGFLIHLLDKAGNVDDENLQDMWAHLLASAVDMEQHAHPVFVNILSQFNSDQALLISGAARFFAFPSSVPDHQQLTSDLRGCIPNYIERNKSEIQFYNSHFMSLGIGSVSSKSGSKVAELTAILRPGHSDTDEQKSEKEVLLSYTKEYSYAPDGIGPALIEACCPDSPVVRST